MKSFHRVGLTIFLIALSASTAASARLDTFEARAAYYLDNADLSVRLIPGLIIAGHRGEPIDPARLKKELEAATDSHGSIDDFDMVVLLRALYLYGNGPNLSEETKQTIKAALLKSKYWIDEPGLDGRCFWSENHQIAYHSSEYLAGALFPDEVFGNSGMTGRQHMEKGRKLARRWLGWRQQFGYSEWLSNVYSMIDAMALVNLIDFAPEEDMQTRARMAMDLLVLDMALNSFQHYQLSTHGRTYPRDIMDTRNEGTGRLLWLWWGGREFTDEMKEPFRSAAAVATSGYRPPRAIINIGNDDAVLDNYQTNGFSPAEAPGLGYPLDDLATGMLFWGSGMYAHHLIADTTARMFHDYNLYGNRFFRGFARTAVGLSRLGILDDFFQFVPSAAQAPFLMDARIRTYRTPEYILSSVMDHRPGEVDAQNFAWIAAMGPDAKVFTTQPGSVISNSTPSYWTANAANPRIAQYRDVAVIVYNTPVLPVAAEGRRLFFNHAYFPKAEFDEVVEKGGWYFARKGDGYLALHSFAQSRWVAEGEWKDREIKAPGLRNVWVCQMGRAADYGSFPDFIGMVTREKVGGGSQSVSYHSPHGLIEFGWTGPLKVDGKEEPIRREMRYDNRYVQAERFPRRIEVRAGGSELILDFDNNSREVKD